MNLGLLIANIVVFCIIVFSVIFILIRKKTSAQAIFRAKQEVKDIGYSPEHPLPQK